MLVEDGGRFLTRAETSQEPPNFFVRSAGNDDKTAPTHITDPAPVLRGIKKQLVTYKRADGVPLSFTLYLPPDYKPGNALPTVVWAYPREFTDPGRPGRSSGSPNRFTTLRGPSHLFFLLQGYAVLDGATHAGGRHAGEGQRHLRRADRRQRQGGDRQGGRDGRDRPRPRRRRRAQLRARS